jgi:starch phosphorylase
MYAYELVRSIFARYVAQNQNFDLDQLLKDGACQYENTFSLTHLAIKKSKIMNGVSHLHTLKLALQYPHASPISVTNGVHVPTWDMVGDDDIHLAHDRNKKKLLDHIKKVTGQDWSPDMLLVTWSRRIVQYKRPLALFENVIRLRKILSEGGARIIIAGIPHPQDAWANDALKHILAFVSNELKGLVVYLPEYNPDVSRMLVGGSDIWLNTPIVGLEACGTSGMKAALNGVLNVSTRDGWMAEATLEEIGWPLDDTTISSDIYLTLLTEVIPLWKAVLSGNTKDWWCMMETARSLIQQSFSAKRMVEDYARIWS